MIKFGSADDFVVWRTGDSLETIAQLVEIQYIQMPKKSEFIVFIANKEI